MSEFPTTYWEAVDLAKEYAKESVRAINERNYTESLAYTNLAVMLLRLGKEALPLPSLGEVLRK